MTYTPLFWIIIVFLLLDYFLSAYLDKKNRSYASYPIPDELAGVYDDEKYKKQQDYFIANNKFASLADLFSLIVMLAMFFLYGFGYVDSIARQIVSVQNELWCNILTGLVFFGILFIADDIITKPFSVYKTFSIEERFGFNKMTPALFISDTIKEWIMTCLLGGILICLLMLIYYNTESYFWLLGWGLMVCFSIGMMMFYSSLIVPLFNKQKPLEEGELRTAIENFCNSVGFKLDNLYVMDSSKRSTKANAYFSGLGSKKRIVLYDTLISTLTTEEIVATLAHEIGHYKRKHTRKMLLINILYFGFIFFLLSLFLKNGDYLAETLGSSKASFWISMIAFGVLFTPISTITGLITNIVSRKNEYEADAFAKEHGLAEPLISALKKLSSSSLSNLTPHPYYVFFHFSHPTLLQRIIALKK